MIRHLAPAIILAFALVACAGGAADQSSGGAVIPSEAAIPSIGPDGAVSEQTVEAAIQVAAAETGVSRDEIRVLAAEAVTWSDGSIGCPEDGMMYTQALVPGYRVILDVAGEELAFHAAEDGNFSPCADPIDPVDDGAVDR